MLHTHTCWQTSLVHTEQNSAAEQCCPPKYPVSPHCRCKQTKGLHKLFMEDGTLLFMEKILKHFCLLKFSVFVNCVHGVSRTCRFSELPGSIKLHLHSTVQRCAAELKLQHEVNLQTKERTACWSDTFHLEEVKYEWAESRE